MPESLCEHNLQCLFIHSYIHSFSRAASAAFHSDREPSPDDQRRKVPSFDALTTTSSSHSRWVTGDAWPSSEATMPPERESHTLTVPSEEAVTRQSGVAQSQQRTEPLCPSKVFAHVYLLVFHS